MKKTKSVEEKSHLGNHEALQKTEGRFNDGDRMSYTKILCNWDP